MSEVALSTPVDRSLFSLHEEEDMVEVPPHRRQVIYLETNCRVELPGRFVGANMGIYWVPGQPSKPWAGPDVFVALGLSSQPDPRVWVTWEDGPIQFVAEVASERTRRQERKRREKTYQNELQVPESLYIDLERPFLGLWRLVNGIYQPVEAVDDRLYSQELNLWFGWDPEGMALVRIWTADGRMLPTVDEVHQARLEAEERAHEERLARLSAEGRIRDAEQYAQFEREQRLAAEARLAELAAELERLRRGMS